MTLIPHDSTKSAVEQTAVVVEGDARFTVITPHCIRLEYAPRYGFVDAPTLFAVDRAARYEGGAVTRRDGMLMIDTGRLQVSYTPDGQAFHPGNLNATISYGNRSVTWEPGQKNKHNLGGPLSTLDGMSGAAPLPDGLLARDGWFLLDDSGRHILVDDWIAQRPGGLPVERGLAHEQDIDWYLFGYGTDYRAALKSLAAVAGRAAMPRRHVLGSWYCRWHPYTSEDFRRIVEEYREHDFPLDILVMDMDWHTLDARAGMGHCRTLGWTGYSWNRDLLPDAETLLRELKADGIRVTLNDHPADGIRDHEACYREFMRRIGLQPRPGQNPPYDPGNRRYLEAVFATAHTPLEAQGVDFWWIDWQQDYAFPYVTGVPGLRHLPWLNERYYRFSERDDARRGQIFSRWGGWGDHRHPIHFSGDAVATWDMLAFQVPFTLASGNTGCFFWAHDVGGFGGERNPECYTRWVQFCALSAALRLHSSGDHLDRRPWLWGQPYVDAMRAAFRLRTRLFPYIYSAVRQCYDEMLPLLRPMYLDAPEEPEAYAHETQYLFGDNLLVAPIVTPGQGSDHRASRIVWLPPGVWYNLLSGERLEGGRTVTIRATIDEIPVYARAGIPLPMQPDTPRMSATPWSTLIVRCYPGERGETLLYEDDGQSRGYLDGACAWTQLRYECRGNRIRLQIGPAEGTFAGQLDRRAYRIELPCTQPVREAKLNGRCVAVAYDAAQRMNVVETPPYTIREPIEIVVTTGKNGETYRKRS